MRRTGSDLPTTRRSFDPFERFFGDLAEPFGTWFGRGVQGDAWTPAVNIEETDDAYLVSAELAGMKKDDVDISVENNVLTISGERKWEKTDEKGEGKTANRQLHRVECGYGAFSRSFALPRQVAAEKVQAKLDNGILHITIPKDEKVRPKRIPIA
jgi:HSP20 family protein